MRRLLLVEDDLLCGRSLHQLYSGQQFLVTWLTMGRDVLSTFRRLTPKVVVLDRVLPDCDGATLCAELRRLSNVPILILSGKAATLDKVKLFELGADEYVTKPFEPLELIVRTEALLRRHGRESNPGVIQSGCLRLDSTRYRVLCDGLDLKLTRIEFELLRLLMAAGDQTTSREVLLDLIWGRNYAGSARTLDTHVSSLRRKISQAKPGWSPLRAVRGTGYRFVV